MDLPKYISRYRCHWPSSCGAEDDLHDMFLQGSCPMHLCLSQALLSLLAGREAPGTTRCCSTGSHGMCKCSWTPQCSSFCCWGQLCTAFLGQGGVAGIMSGNPGTTGVLSLQGQTRSSVDAGPGLAESLAKEMAAFAACSVKGSRKADCCAWPASTLHLLSIAATLHL